MKPFAARALIVCAALAGLPCDALAHAFGERYDLPAPLSGDRGGGFPPRLIWIGSYSKARSLAGLRAGYLLAAQPVVDYVRKHNERQSWSPVNAACSALIADEIASVGLGLRDAAARTARHGLDE